MTHFEWIMKSFNIIASDSESESVLFWACGELCGEINGQPFHCKDENEFWELVEFFKGETFAE